jgi:hypothetical protein
MQDLRFPQGWLEESMSHGIQRLVVWGNSTAVLVTDREGP